MNKSGWIAVDLDGTLAEYGQWQGADHIGKPIPKMVARVKQWLSEGKNVKIFTARIASDSPLSEVYFAIYKWSKEHIGVILPVTCSKDYHMYELWDDRAVQVYPNSGVSLQETIEELQLELARLRNQERT